MQAAAIDSISIWKRMGEERRKQAALAFYKDDSASAFQRAAESFIARQRNFRPQFVKRLPLEKRAQYLATMALPADVVSQLIVAYHFAFQRPMMADFLDALGIANDQGMIAEGLDVQPPGPERLAEAVSAIKAKYSEEDAEIYLETLFAQNSQVWAGVEAFLQK